MEMWKDIIGYKGIYSVSNEGRIKSNKYGYILSPNKFRNQRYCRVKLYKKGHFKRFPVHRLVMTSFIGKVPKGNQINHIDGNKYNNNLYNLEYCTPKENCIHSYKNGLQKPTVGSLHGQSVLTENDVINIRSSSNELSLIQLSKIYNVTPENISLIIRRKRWKHI